MDALIYDRTAVDVANETDKGFWQVADLTRINEWIDYLAAAFGLVLVTTNYSLGDMTDIAEVVANTAAIRSGHTWSDTPATPTVTAWNYVKANYIEKILFDADKWETARLQGIRYCGTITAGQDFSL